MGRAHRHQARPMGRRHVISTVSGPERQSWPPRPAPTTPSTAGRMTGRCHPCDRPGRRRHRRRGGAGREPDAEPGRAAPRGAIATYANEGGQAAALNVGHNMVLNTRSQFPGALHGRPASAPQPSRTSPRRSATAPCRSATGTACHLHASRCTALLTLTRQWKPARSARSWPTSRPEFDQARPATYPWRPSRGSGPAAQLLTQPSGCY